MHVAVDGRVIDPHFPGIGRATYRLAEALAQTQPADRFTLLVTPGQHDPRFDLAALTTAPNLRLATVAAPVFGLAAQWRVPRAVRAMGADVFHATYWLTPWRPGRPTVLSVYDLIGLSLPGAVPPTRRLVLALALRLAVRSAEILITLSEWSRRDVVAHFGRRPEHVVVTPLAADPNFAPPAPEAVAVVRQRYDLPERYVLYLGINKPHKNLALLLDAWAGLAGRMPLQDSALVLAGPWDDRYDALRQQALALPPGAPVRILGPVADRDLPALLGGAAAFTFPSRYEGFGLPPLEAMACGTPVLAADASSLPEVVADAGLLLPPDDAGAWSAAIGRVLGDERLAAELRARGLERARSFTWQATAAATRGAYAACLARRQAASPRTGT